MIAKREDFYLHHYKRGC